MSFCQNDSLVTHILHELCLFWYLPHSKILGSTLYIFCTFYRTLNTNPIHITFLSYLYGSSLKISKNNFTWLWLQLSDSNGHPIHLTNQDSMHMSHMKRDRFLSYWLCDTWTLKIKKEHDMHNQTSGIHQKWGFNSQQSKAKVKGRCYHLPQNWSMIFVSYS